MSNILYIRSNVDWSKCQDEFNIEDENVHKHMTEDGRKHILRFVEWWNNIFGMNFFYYRHEIQQISELNFGAIKYVDKIYRYKAFDSVECQYDCVLPVDDDDWFHPDIFEKLDGCINPQWDVVNWPIGFYNSCPSQKNYNIEYEEIRITKHIDVLQTNNYLLMYNGLNKLMDYFNNDKKSDCLTHLAGKDVLNKKFNRIYFDECLSITNKHLAAITNIRHINSEQDLVRNVEFLNKYPTIPEELSWARPYIDLMYNLNVELYKSAK